MRGIEQDGFEDQIIFQDQRKICFQTQPCFGSASKGTDTVKVCYHALLDVIISLMESLKMRLQSNVCCLVDTKCRSIGFFYEESKVKLHNLGSVS